MHDRREGRHAQPAAIRGLPLDTQRRRLLFAPSAPPGRTQWTSLATDAEIRRTSPPELVGFPAGFWVNAAVVSPAPKQSISLEADRDVLRSYVAAMRERTNSRGSD